MMLAILLLLRSAHWNMWLSGSISSDHRKIRGYTALLKNKVISNYSREMIQNGCTLRSRDYCILFDESFHLFFGQTKMWVYSSPAEMSLSPREVFFLKKSRQKDTVKAIPNCWIPQFPRLSFEHRRLWEMNLLVLFCRHPYDLSDYGKLLDESFSHYLQRKIIKKMVSFSFHTALKHITKPPHTVAFCWWWNGNLIFPDICTFPYSWCWHLLLKKKKKSLCISIHFSSLLQEVGDVKWLFSSNQRIFKEDITLTYKRKKILAISYWRICVVSLREMMSPNFSQLQEKHLSLNHWRKWRASNATANINTNK